MRSDLAARVASIEQKHGVSECTLNFRDGSTRSVRLKDGLGILLDAMRERSRQIGPPEGCEDDPRPENPPLTRHAEAINLLSRAASIESPDPFVHLIHETCAEVKKHAATEKPNVTPKA